MENRNAAVIITVVAVILCGCPGLAALCWGLASLFDFAVGGGIIASTNNAYYWNIFGGFCVGIIFVAIAVVVAFFVLRRKKVTPPPVPPVPPDEPLPPTI